MFPEDTTLSGVAGAAQCTISRVRLFSFHGDVSINTLQNSRCVPVCPSVPFSVIFSYLHHLPFLGMSPQSLEGSISPPSPVRCMLYNLVLRIEPALLPHRFDCHRSFLFLLPYSRPPAVHDWNQIIILEVLYIPPRS